MILADIGVEFPSPFARGHRGVEFLCPKFLVWYSTIWAGLSTLDLLGRSPGHNLRVAFAAVGRGDPVGAFRVHPVYGHE